MWTGRQTLATIEQAIANLRGDEGQLDRVLRSAVDEVGRLRQERSDALKELARVKLDEMTAGRLVSDLDAGERRAVQLLYDYRQRIAEAIQRREQLMREVGEADRQRHAAAADVEAALEAVAALRTEVEGRVQTNPDWRTAAAALKDAEAIAAEAEHKAASSEAELSAKKKPYDDDPLFIYLWRRNYGRGSYEAGRLARALDEAVARFIGYRDARINYAALTEIPLRLREHATGKRGAADASKAAVSEIERRAMLEAGVEEKEERLAEAREKLAAADAEAEKKHALLRKAEEEHAALVSAGSNPAYDQALAVIASADSKDDLATLFREARRTPTSADEAIVHRLEAIDAGIAKADAEIAAVRRSAQDLARRRLEVEQVRDRFRRAGYDHPSTTFGNDSDIAQILKRILSGAAAGGTLWDLLRTGYGYRLPRGRPDFGYPRLPFPFPMPGGGTIGSSGGGWREPTTRGGWSPDYDFPWSGPGTRRDDGFSTGGSFLVGQPKQRR